MASSTSGDVGYPIDEPIVSTSDAQEQQIVKSELHEESINIMDLNGHCQLELLERLALADLCSMAEVCTHFNALTKKMFALKHKNVVLSSINGESGKYTLKQACSLLRNFGNMIEDLTIDVSKLNICTAINSKFRENWHEQKMLKHIPNLKKVDNIQKLLTLIRRYCVATIDKLEIEYCSQTQIGEFFPLTRIRSQYMTSKYIFY